MTGLKDYRRAVEAAITTAERKLANLYDPSTGAKVFSPEQHAQQVSRILAEFDEAVAPQVRVVKTRKANAERSLQALESGPESALSTEELTRAAAMRDFVREDADRLPLQTLAERMRAAEAAGDRVQQFLWSHYAQQRAAAEQGQPAGLQDTAAQVHEVRTLARQLDDQLRPDREQKRRALMEAKGEALEIIDLADRRRPKYDENGDPAAAPRYAFQSRQDRQW